MTARTQSWTTCFIVSALALGGCARAVVYPAPVTGESETMVVRGEYQPVAIDRVDALSVANGQLVVHGGRATVSVPLPPLADVAQPTHHWALVTERDTGRARAITFTHNESLDDFTIELPAADAEIRYGVFTGREGGEVMVFAWGAESRSFYGWVTLNRRSVARHE